jgi:uracil-DNA glycosylase family 4
MATVKGFFTTDQLNAVGINGPSSGECNECGLANKPDIKITGEGKKEILVILPYPQVTDDAKNLLRNKLKTKGINLDTDCWLTYAICCHPGIKPTGKDKDVTRKHVQSCQPIINKTISDLKPKFIWLLGDVPVTSYFMDRESNTEITRWRALCIPDIERKAWVTPFYDPAFVLSKEKDEHIKMVFDRDILFAVKCLQRNAVPDKENLSRAVTILKSYDDVVRELKKVLANSPDKFAFDYETTGKKPYRKGHRIASISFCYEKDRAYSFPYQYRDHFTLEQKSSIADLWIQIIEHKKIKRVIQNSKFEDMWTREFFGIEADAWWCTMLTSHIQDCRSEFSGLKFQALVRWGIPDYSSHMEKFLKPPSKDTPFNRVMEAPLNDLLLYGGMDSLLTFRLQEEQEYELLPYKDLSRARKFFMDSSITLCDIQENGIPMNREYYLTQDVVLEKRIAEMKESLYKFPEAVKFERIRGRRINFNSSPDLADLFFNILQLPKGKQTAGGNDCTDASVLAKLKTPIANELTVIKKIEKAKGTYLGQFIREIEDDDKLHPFFDILVPTTYRGSSNSPNFQNIPVRDEEVKKITRSGIISSLDNQLIDWDYGAMEVRIIACYSQDPKLMAYIFDESTDMHRDIAIELFNFEKTWKDIPNKLAKKIRFEGKNGATFPWFYGSYYKNIARNIFAKCMAMICYENITVLEHLMAVGVIKHKSKAYEEFEEHVKKVEQRFWHRFKGVKAWQEKSWKDYLAKGYIEQMFGFRCSGYLTRNDVVNWPIQGTAFHCLLWSINEINRRMKDDYMKSLMIGQIHDCCLSDLYPPEKQKLMTMSNLIATKEIREVHKWINVPLLIEWEEAPINASWADKVEVREE